MGISDRLKRLRKHLYEVEFEKQKEWWFQNVNILDFDEYSHLKSEPIPIRKAYSFQYVAKNLPIIIKDDELIVGCPNQMSVEFGMSIPNYLTQEEKEYFNHWGLSEQSISAHHPPAWDSILKFGTIGLKKRIQAQMKSEEQKAFVNEKRMTEWKAMLVSLDAVEIYASRYADAIKILQNKCMDVDRKADYEEMENVCRRIPYYPAETLWEAVQSYWFLYTVLNSGGEFLPLGRIDQYFYPYYEKDITEKRITAERATDIVGSFLIKCNERIVLDPKILKDFRNIGYLNCGDFHYASDDELRNWKAIVHDQHYWHEDESVDGVHNKFFGQETNNLMMTGVVGGVDSSGEDATNAMSEIIINLKSEMKLLLPTLGVRIHKKTPQKFLGKVIKALCGGQGEPIIYNDEAILRGYQKLHMPLADARQYSSDGCWETVIPGKTNFIYGVVFVLQCLEWTMNDGITLKSGRRESFRSGKLADFVFFDEFYEAFLKHVYFVMESIVNGFIRSLGIASLVAPDPLFSALSDSCVERGSDYYDDGAEYQSRMILLAGLPDAVDSLVVIKKLVFEEKKISLPELNNALLSNWEGYGRLHALVRNCVEKYGNDNDYADDVLARILNDVSVKLRELRNKTTKIELMGGIGTFHVYGMWGDITAASANGRYNYEALAPNFSPVPSCDKKGPLSVIKSSTKADLSEFMGGTPIDISINANDFQGEAGVKRLQSLIHGFCELGGQIITITASTIEELEDAKIHPENHKNLLVRMGGLSAHFISLAPVQQDMIIERFRH